MLLTLALTAAMTAQGPHDPDSTSHYAYPVIRCGCDHHAPINPALFAQYRSGGPCGATFNVDDMIYDPANRPLYQIPIVFHLIGDNTSPSAVTQTRIDDQMSVLNDAFEAAQIEFSVAAVLRYNNSDWTMDIGDYWTPNAVDPTTNLNVYVLNQPSPAGILGYVSDFPFTPGFPGSATDRIVLLDHTVGVDTLPASDPLSGYDEGVTLVHEIGHYLGLYHTFETAFDGPVCPTGGCACLNASSTLTGDLITDTEVSLQSGTCSAFFGASACQAIVGTSFVPCPSASTLASPCPTFMGAQQEWNNYMSYSSDRCTDRFSPEQIRRMHCTLDSFRPDLGTPAGPVGVASYCSVVNNSTGQFARLAATATSSTGILANNFRVVGERVPAFETFLPLMSRTQAYFPNFFPGSPGVLCLGGPYARLNGEIGSATSNGLIEYDVNWNAIPEGTGFVSAVAGEVWNTQVWFRDGAVSNTTEALEVPVR